MKIVSGIISVTMTVAFLPLFTQAQVGGFSQMSRGLFGGACDINALDDKALPTAKSAFDKARAFEKAGSFCEAAQQYMVVKRIAPQNFMFEQSQYRIVLALQKAGEWDQAITQGKEYLLWYPAGANAEHVMFVVAECFHADRGSSGTDQDWTVKAQRAFNEYLKKYPEGKFAASAREKLQASFNELAQKEIIVARHYMARGQYTAVAQRMTYLATYFRSSDVLPEGLYLAAFAFERLNRPEDLAAVKQILNKLHAKSPWTAKANLIGVRPAEELEPKSWVTRIP